jgi:hypothetical protein
MHVDEMPSPVDSFIPQLQSRSETSCGSSFVKLVANRCVTWGDCLLCDWWVSYS